MHDNYISRAAMIASLLWTTAGALVVTVWVLAAKGADLRFCGAVFATAALCMSLAAVYHVRLYVLRLCGLIRVSAGLQAPDAEIHTLDRPRV